METLYNTREALRNIRKAFKLLRREGVQTELGYVCCMSCGASEGLLFSPLVYTLREDETEFGANGVLPVYFRNPDSSDLGGTRALGDQVRIALEVSGLRVDWSGDPAHAVMVMA